MGVTLLDTDAKIVETTGRTIADIFATDGEKEFRRIEEEVVREALDIARRCALARRWRDHQPRCARSTFRAHRRLPRDQRRRGMRRTTAGGTVRPLLAGGDPAEKFRALLSQRVPLYRRAATIRVNTNRRNPGAVVRYIVSRLENPRADDAPPRPRRRRRPSWRRTPVSLTPEPSEPS